MKKIIILLLVITLLYSCWSKKTEEKIVSSFPTIEYIWESFSVFIPKDWVIISNESSELPKPKDWKITLSVKSNAIKYGFSNNMIILSQKLNKTISSSDYSIINNVWSSKDYLEYIKLESKDITFQDNTKSILYIFEAKYNTNTPKFKYLQTAKICKDTANMITIALSNDIKKYSDYENLLKTMTCVNK